jgi:hypothetical protein
MSMRIRIPTTAVGLLLAAAACAAEPSASLPPVRLHYVSAFDGYPTHVDAKTVDWSRSNALVGELQGHAGHWRAAAATDRPAPKPPQTGAAKP